MIKVGSGTACSILGWGGVDILGVSSSYGERVRLEILNENRMYLCFLVLAVMILKMSLRMGCEGCLSPISSPDGNRSKGSTPFMLKPLLQS